MTDERRYNAVAIALHWIIALLIFANIGLAWYFNTLHGLAKVGPEQIHKSTGILVLILSLARLAWRFISPPPPPLAGTPVWERYGAALVDVLFYVVMIGMPLTGWALTSATPLASIFPTSLFGLVPWPSLPWLADLPAAQMKHAHHLYTGFHSLGAKLAYVLIVLHVGAALRHQYLKRDAVLWRMLPLVEKPS